MRVQVADEFCNGGQFRLECQEPAAHLRCKLFRMGLDDVQTSQHRGPNEFEDWGIGMFRAKIIQLQVMQTQGTLRIPRRQGTID